VYRTHKQPLGHATRGKTAPGRLRRLDRFLVLEEPALLRRTQGAFVDLGYGRVPTTTLDSAARFRRLNPDLLVVGLEIDPERVARAQPHADARTRFRRGGFDLPLRADERMTIGRAMNVLRQYPPEAVPDAHAQILAKLAPGGVFVEGTSTPTGHHMVVNVLRPGRPTEVVFSVNPAQIPERPSALAAILPKDHIHRMVPGEPIHDLLEVWDRIWEQTRHHGVFGPLVHWAAAGQALFAHPEVLRRPSLLRKGYVIWRPPTG
jgi:hypothetical protein